MTKEEQAVIKKWFNTEFRDAVVNDMKRLEEAILVLKVGHDKGDDPLKCIGVSIASFVGGVIKGSVPITVDTDMN